MKMSIFAMKIFIKESILNRQHECMSYGMIDNVRLLKNDNNIYVYLCNMSKKELRKFSREFLLQQNYEDKYSFNRLITICDCCMLNEKNDNSLVIYKMLKLIVP